MEHRDRLRSGLAWVGCTACGSVLAADRIRVLAERGRGPARASRPG